MTPVIPAKLVSRAECWSSLKRWERRELGQQLRRLGLSYREISAIIPVGRGTLSGWCRDVQLTTDQVERLKEIRPSLLIRRSLGQRSRERARQRSDQIRRAGKDEGQILILDPFWVAGVVAYWAEGSKRSNEIQFSNSDPGMISLFIRWAREYFGLEADRFAAQLHLHDGQDEEAMKEFWCGITGLTPARFAARL